MHNRTERSCTELLLRHESQTVELDQTQYFSDSCSMVTGAQGRFVDVGEAGDKEVTIAIIVCPSQNSQRPQDIVFCSTAAPTL